MPGPQSPVPGMHRPQAGIPGIPGVPGTAAPVPPFMKQPEPPKMDHTRDPFAAPAAAQARISQMPAPMSYHDDGVAVTDAEVGKSKRFLYIIIACLFVPFFAFGYYCGISFRERLAYNLAIVDGRSVKAEVEKAVKLFNSFEPVITQAVDKLKSRDFDPNHIDFISQNIVKSPFPPEAFSNKSYKVFEPMIVQNLFSYYQKWNVLADMCKTHMVKSKNDQNAITAARGKAEELLKTQYGVVFNVNEGMLFSALVMLGAPGQDKKGNPTYEIQARAGTFASERAIYLPETEEPIWKEPENWVVPIDDRSKTGLLALETQAQFNEYQGRLLVIQQLMKEMSDIQRALMQGLDEIAQLQPRFVFGFDVDEEVAKNTGAETN